MYVDIVKPKAFNLNKKNVFLSLVAHRYAYAPLSCRTLQYSSTFILFSVSPSNDLANPVFDGV